MSFKRTDRINEEIKKELSSIIRELKDPRIPMMTSVVNVNVTNDLRYAKAYISVMGTDEEKHDAIKGLKAAAGFIRREVGSRIKLRAVPEFTFELDNTIEYGAHINKLLNDISKETRKELFFMKQVTDHLKNSKSVAIFVHTNPDWDCIGSAMALRSTLRSIGIKSDVFTETPLSKHLSILDTDVIPYSDGVTAPDYECYCAVDVGGVDRIGLWGKFFDEKENTVCIDHHYQSAPFGKISYVEPKRSATGELIYEMLVLGGLEVTQEIASYLYCAISSDTGSLQYASVNRRTYEIVIALTDTGINTTWLCSMLYERNTLTQLKLKAEAINSIKLYKNGTIATAKLTNETMVKYNADKTDADALAQLPRSIDGVMMSAFLKELPDGDIRVNLRSLGDYSVEPVARMFGGGGHKKAAGCTFSGVSIEEAERQLLEELEKL